MNPAKRKKIYRLNLKTEEISKTEEAEEILEKKEVETEDTTGEEVVKAGRKKKTT